MNSNVSWPKTWITRSRITVGVAALLVIALAVVGGQQLSAADSSSATGDQTIVQTANRVTMTLVGVQSTPSATTLTFALDLPDAVANSAEPNILGPIFVGQQL